MFRLPPWRSFRCAIAANVAVTMALVCVGWWRQTTVAPAPVAIEDRWAPADASAHVQAIVSGNVRVVGWMAAGACAGGLPAAIIEVWNGYLLGFALGALSRARPAALVLALSYAPIEFLAFAVAAGASQVLAIDLAGYALNRTSVRTGQVVLALASAVLLLVIAAFVEVRAGYRIRDIIHGQ